MPLRLRARRGVALVTALVAVVVILVLIAGGFYTSTQEFRSGRNLLVEQRAFAVSEYGLNYEVSHWDRSRNLNPPTGMAIGGVDSTPRYVAEGDTAYVRVTRLTPTTYWVVSDGRASIGVGAVESRRRVSAFVRLAYPAINARAAVTAAGDVELTGASRVYGANTSPANWTNCTEYEGGEVAAIMVPPGADVDYRAANLPGNIDILRDPVAADEETYVRYGSETWNSLVANADIRIPGGVMGSDILPVGTDTSCVASSTNWGEPFRPGAGGGATIVQGCYGRFPIIYAAGDLALNGRGRGQGILLVNGDLRLNGTFDFYGIIIVRDDIERGNGTASIHGAVFSRDANLSDDSYWSGTQDVYFSRCAIESALRASAILTRVRDRHWTQLY